MKHEGWGDKKNTTSQEESVLDGILRFLEVLNRIKRLQPPKVPQTPKVSWTKGKKYFRTILCEVLFNRDIAWHLVWNCRDTTSSGLFSSCHWYCIFDWSYCSTTLATFSDNFEKQLHCAIVVFFCWFCFFYSGTKAVWGYVISSH